MEGSKTDSVLQRFANGQNVISYGNKYVASFSSAVEYKKSITEYSEKVYLYSYANDIIGKPWEDSYLESSLAVAGLGGGVLYSRKKIDMVECIPKSE